MIYLRSMENNKKIEFDIKKYALKHLLFVAINPQMLWYTFSRNIPNYPKTCVWLYGSIDFPNEILLISALAVSVNDVETFIIGGHGDDMVPQLITQQ